MTAKTHRPSPEHTRAACSVWRFWFLFVLLGVLAGLGCGTAKPDASGSSSIQVILNWFPESEHGGFYAALVHGYYKDEGLEVTFVPGGLSVPTIQRVANGQVPFGVANAEAILLGRAEEADLVALMAPMQDSPQVIIVHAKSGIRKLSDIQGVTLAMQEGNPAAQYIRRKAGLKDVRHVPYSGNVTQFMVNEKYAQQGYLFSEPFIIKKNGGDPYSIMISESGFNPYTSVLFTRTELVKEKPDLVAKMVRASVRGWQTYLREPKKTNDYIREINPEMADDILEFGAKAIGPLALPGKMPEAKLGDMTRERWQTLADQMRELDLIKGEKEDVDRVFTTRFLAGR